MPLVEHNEDGKTFFFDSIANPFLNHNANLKIGAVLPDGEVNIYFSLAPKSNNISIKHISGEIRRPELQNLVCLLYHLAYFGYEVVDQTGSKGQIKKMYNFKECELPKDFVYEFGNFMAEKIRVVAPRKPKPLSTISKNEYREVEEEERDENNNIIPSESINDYSSDEAKSSDSDYSSSDDDVVGVSESPSTVKARRTFKVLENGKEDEYRLRKNEDYMRNLFVNNGELNEHFQRIGLTGTWYFNKNFSSHNEDKDLRIFDEQLNAVKKLGEDVEKKKQSLTYFENELKTYPDGPNKEIKRKDAEKARQDYRRYRQEWLTTIYKFFGLIDKETYKKNKDLPFTVDPATEVERDTDEIFTEGEESDSDESVANDSDEISTEEEESSAVTVPSSITLKDYFIRQTHTGQDNTRPENRIVVRYGEGSLTPFTSMSDFENALKLTQKKDIEERSNMSNFWHSFKNLRNYAAGQQNAEAVLEKIEKIRKTKDLAEELLTEAEKDEEYEAGRSLTGYKHRIDALLGSNGNDGILLQNINEAARQKRQLMSVFFEDSVLGITDNTEEIRKIKEELNPELSAEELKKNIKAQNKKLLYKTLLDILHKKILKKEEGGNVERRVRISTLGNIDEHISSNPIEITEISTYTNSNPTRRITPQFLLPPPPVSQSHQILPPPSHNFPGSPLRNAREPMQIEYQSHSTHTIGHSGSPQGQLLSQSNSTNTHKTPKISLKEYRRQLENRNPTRNDLDHQILSPSRPILPESPQRNAHGQMQNESIGHFGSPQIRRRSRSNSPDNCKKPRLLDVEHDRKSEDILRQRQEEQDRLREEEYFKKQQEQIEIDEMWETVKKTIYFDSLGRQTKEDIEDYWLLNMDSLQQAREAAEKIIQKYR